MEQQIDTIDIVYFATVALQSSTRITSLKISKKELLFRIVFQQEMDKPIAVHAGSVDKDDVALVRDGSFWRRFDHGGHMRNTP